MYRFKGLPLESGDIVAFTTTSVLLPEVQATVIEVKDGVLEVLSTLLLPYKHIGRFKEEEVGQIELIYPAKIAVPRESGQKKFQKDQSVSTLVGKVSHQGKVIAAFDGLVVARQDDGQLITGGASFFNRVA